MSIFTPVKSDQIYPELTLVIPQKNPHPQKIKERKPFKAWSLIYQSF